MSLARLPIVLRTVLSCLVLVAACSEDEPDIPTQVNQEDGGIQPSADGGGESPAITLAQLEIETDSTTLFVEHPGKLRAFGVFADGRREQLGREVKWVLSDGANASIKQEEAEISITGHSSSEIDIRATYADREASQHLSVIRREDLRFAFESSQHPIQDQVFYFALVDRFANGDSANDRGDYVVQEGKNPDAEAERRKHGFWPDKGQFWHGGDIRGFTDKLDYLTGLGITAIWVSPIFKNKAVHSRSLIGSADGNYHGYATIDYTQVDPHFGTNEEFATFVNAAHGKGMQIFLDVPFNHTADVIHYKQEETKECPNVPCSYRAHETHPYQSAAGPFDDHSFIDDTKGFPEMKDTDFPYTPYTLLDERNIKRPSWLNDLRFYHNRGASTFAGASATYGDFYILDDLFTEHPVVVQGFINIAKEWIRAYRIDGFRMDAAKHINPEFWQRFVPTVTLYANELGIKDFFIFGEVRDTTTVKLSSYIRSAGLPAATDLAFQDKAVAVTVDGSPTDVLKTLFEDDDRYIDSSHHAYRLPTLLGDHDIGRFGAFVRRTHGLSSDKQNLARARLAHALMYFSRGFPVVYYGDEQGFTGGRPKSTDINDWLSRQDMFESKVATFIDPTLNRQIGSTGTPALDNFNPQHPLFLELRNLSDLRKAHRALRRGVQVHRYSSNEPDGGLYAFSRIALGETIEYVIALNTHASQYKSAPIAVYQPMADYEILYTSPNDKRWVKTVKSDAAGALTLELPPLSIAVYRASNPLPPRSAAPRLSLSTKDGLIDDVGPVTVDVADNTLCEVTVEVLEQDGAYRLLGTDVSPPYRVFFDGSKLRAGDSVQFRSSVRDHTGNTRSAISKVNVTTNRGQAIIHYSRADNAQAKWGLHLWGDALRDEDCTGWQTPRMPDGQDDYGALFHVPVRNMSLPLSFVIHLADEKDGDTDRSFVPKTSPELWLRQGDPEMHTTRP